MTLCAARDAPDWRWRSDTTAIVRQLLLVQLDQVLHLPARVVEAIVNPLRRAMLQVRDDEADVEPALAPITREERAAAGKTRVDAAYDDKLQAFLDFVLAQYVREGDVELDQEKLDALVQLKYRSTNEAAVKLGGAIPEAFVGFQR